MKKNVIMTNLAAVAVMVGITSCTGTDQAAENNKCNATEAVIENIMTRTSVRRFSEKAVAKDTLDLLLRAGMAAPTAVNKQPWAYVAITERQILDSLDAVHPHAHLAGASAAIVVCGDLNRTLEGRSQEYWIQDCSASTENILLAAHAYGLGAVWCGVYPDDERISGVRRVLQLPENIIPLNVITIGYPAGENQPKDKWDPEKIHYQKW